MAVTMITGILLVCRYDSGASTALESIHPGHLHADQDQIGSRSPRAADRVRTIGGGMGRVAGNNSKVWRYASRKNSFCVAQELVVLRYRVSQLISPNFAFISTTPDRHQNERSNGSDGKVNACGTRAFPSRGGSAAVSRGFTALQPRSASRHWIRV
jgi:hypothetical protein